MGLYKAYNHKISVNNSKDLQKALDDEYIDIIFLEDGEYSFININLEGKVLIGKNQAVFVETIFINSSVSLIGINFKPKMTADLNNIGIYINAGKVSFTDICIDGSNSNKVIGIKFGKNSESRLEAVNCTFKDLYIGIDLGEYNTLGMVKNNVFNNVYIGITGLYGGAVIEDIDMIYENRFYGEEGSKAIMFSTGVQLKEKEKIELLSSAKLFARRLSLNNNFARVKGCGLFSQIDVYAYYVTNDDEFAKALEDCDNGAIIRLAKGLYYGDIIINKEITIIGEDMDETILIPKKSFCLESSLYGISINSSNVLIQNLTMDGKGNTKLEAGQSYFRDGIHYVGRESNNNQFINLKIKNIKRRGISIWPESTKNTIIENCLIENVLNQQGIYFNGSGIIKNCKFKNAPLGIYVNNKTETGTIKIE